MEVLRELVHVVVLKILVMAGYIRLFLLSLHSSGLLLDDILVHELGFSDSRPEVLAHPGVLLEVLDQLVHSQLVLRYNLLQFLFRFLMVVETGHTRSKRVESVARSHFVCQ